MTVDVDVLANQLSDLMESTLDRAPNTQTQRNESPNMFDSGNNEEPQGRS